MFYSGAGIDDDCLATQVRTSFEAERLNNTLLVSKDVSAVLNEGEVIEAVIGRRNLRVRIIDCRA